MGMVHLSGGLRLATFSCIGLVLLLLAGCSGGRIELLGTNFEQEVDRTQNLRFTFNQTVVSDTLIGRWDTTAYVAFEPAIAGRFQWTGANELVFSPTGPLAASTDYTATITSAVAKADSAGNRRSVETKELKFHTPYLDIASAHSYWTRGADGPEARLQLSFNYKVTPAQVGQLLGVAVAGKPSPHALLNESKDEPTTEVTISVKDVPVKLDENLQIVLEVKPGLQTTESSYTSAAPIKHMVEFPMAKAFSLSSVQAKHVGGEGIVDVYLTQALLDGPAVARQIRITPSVDYRVIVTENGFQLRGGFDETQQYQLSIGSGLTSILGIQLGRDVEQSIVFEQAGAAIQFASQRGMYLSGGGSRNVAVNVSGMARVRVKISKIYQNNLLAFYRGGQVYDGEYNSETDEYYNYDYYDTELYGDVIQERIYDVQTLQRNGGTRLLSIDFVDTRSQFPGIYVVEVGDPERLWIRASKILSISDIGLIARRSGNDIAVFANSILSAEALKDINVQLISSNNQNIYTAKTDGDGVAWFRDLNTKAPGFRSAMITASKGEGVGTDFNVLMLQQSRVETSRFDVGGKNLEGRPYDAYLYGDRELYRPGDTVYLNTIVRNPDWNVVKEMPVQLRVLLPSGKEMQTLQGTLNEQGSFSTQFALGVAAPTGTYQLELRTGSNQLLTSRGIAVEEFMPDKIRLQAKLDRERYTSEQDLSITLQADNLYGTPAAYRNWELELTYSRSAMTPKGLEQFDFSLNGERDLGFVQRNGQTDGSGQAAVRITDLEQFQNIGKLEGRVYATVFDESARPVHRVSRFTLFTQRVFFGIGPFATYAAPRVPLQIPLAAVDMEGKPVQAQARIQVIRNHWETVVEKTYGGFRYKSVKRPQTLVDRLVSIPASQTKFEFLPSQDGEYEVRLSKPGAEMYVVSYFYSYGWGSDGASNFEVSTDGNIIIEADKETYQVGNTANLLFKTPFEGKLLVTIERENVLEHQYLTTEGNAAKLSLKLDDKHLPNVYITATLIRPMKGSDPSLPLMVAHGFQPIRVESAERKLPLKIAAIDKSTSRTTQMVTVTTQPGAEVTIAAVDEGILQIKNTATPNPYDYFYARRALAVEAFDLYASLLPELGRGSSTGGDGYDLSRRVNPLANKRVKLLSLWSGTRKADGNGVVRFPVKIPQFAGSVRIMAVSYKDNAFASAEHNMIVADPVVLTTALPRFLSPGDTLLVPVTMANTTKSAGAARASIKATGSVRVIGTAVGATQLPANGEGRVFFQVAAQQAIGNATITVTVNAIGGTYTEEIDLPVRPAAPLTKFYGAGSVADGKTAGIDLRGAGLFPATRQAKLVVSKSPLVQYSRALDELLGYPHGCLEQTVSKAFPQIYYADLAKSIGRKGTQINTPDYTIAAAVSKLQGMQRYDGSLSFWPGASGGTETNWWGIVYAAHFLYEADRAGYNVSPDVMRRLLDWIESQSSQRATTRQYLADGSFRDAPAREIFYSLYVLALNGRGQLPTMNYWKAEVAKLTPDSRYLLGVAYALMGDAASQQRVIASAQELEAGLTNPETGGSFASPIRDRAVALYTLLETDAKSSQVPELARRLSEAINNRTWLTTQESSWGFLALGRWARLQEQKGTPEGSLKFAGKTLDIDRLGDSSFVASTGLAGQTASLTATDGTLFYFWDQSGIPSSGPVPEQDRMLRVRRSYFSRTGTALSTTTFRQNDLVVVRLSVQATENDAIANVVVGDLLPAGFEIENPRLSELPELSWIKDATTPDHQDFRDDRVFFYTDLPAGGRVQHFYYVVRAVSPGTFQQGPASADAMYRGDFASQSGAGTITVLPNTGAAKGDM